MFLDRRTTRGLLLVTVLAAAAACADRTSVSSPLGPSEATVVTAGPQSSSKVKVKTFQLSSNSLGIEGAAVSGNVSVANSGLPIDGVTIRGQITQGAATREAMSMGVNCAGTPGTLPGGACNMTFNASASNSADGTGTLAAGAAVLELDVVQTVNGAETVLASKTLNITLVTPLGISSLTLTSSTLVIDGAGVGWTATITNPGSAIHGVVLQGTVIQGSTQRAAGGTQINCGGGLGVLPSGTCTISFTAAASNSGSGNGTFVPGAATFQLQLIQSAATTTVLDTKTVNVTLVSSHIAITSVTVNPQNFAIDGPSTAVTVVLNNPTGVAVSGLRLAELLTQSIGPVSRAAGGASLSCGAGDGIMPIGNCTMTIPASASNSAAGSGTLIAQLAFLEVDLVQSTAGNDVTVDSKSVAVGLLRPPTPLITNATLGAQYVVLGGPTLTYSVSLNNQNINTFSSVIAHVRLMQGGIEYQVTGGPVDCGAGTGVFPSGSCTVTGGMNVPSSVAGLSLGAATIEVDLFQFTGSSLTPYDSKSIPVTVITNTLGIASVQLASSTIAIGGSTPITVTVYNPSNADLSELLVQGEIIQGTADRAAGGTVVICGGATPGVLPPGVCTFQSVAIVSNTNSGNGTFVAGAATFQLTLELYDGTTTTSKDVKSFPVTLVSNP